jgi:DNA replication and repair protein RecF
MSLGRLDIREFRCIESADLEFDARCNLIGGPNASGKTSLLEAIFFLGRGRSFRAPHNQALIRKGARDLTLAGRLESALAVRPLGVRYGRDGFEAKAAGERLSSLAELASVFPVQSIDPEIHRLIEEGPHERRRYLDWGVFHVEPRFVDQWRRYQRVLKQRNAALRAESPIEVVRAWDPELVEAGHALAGLRRRYLASLADAVRTTGERMVGAPIELTLQDGWAADETLQAALDNAWERDRLRGTTLIGPHRADLRIKLGGHAARHHVSRGQQKLIAAAMLLGQLHCDAALGSPTAAVLVDDPAAELDFPNLGRLVAELVDLPAQLFVTALNPSVPAFERLPEPRRFHVEHGRIARLV